MLTCITVVVRSCFRVHFFDREGLIQFHFRGLTAWGKSRPRHQQISAGNMLAAMNPSGGRVEKRG